MMQQTSLQALESIINTLGRRQKLVLDVIKRLYAPSNAEIAEYIGKSINTVTPRVFELRRLGLVKKYMVRNCKVTGRRVNTWRCV